jgi:hypothetical protein
MYQPLTKKFEFERPRATRSSIVGEDKREMIRKLRGKGEEDMRTKGEVPSSLHKVGLSLFCCK